MKLSEIITYCADSHIEGIQYLIINGYETPHVRVDSYPTYLEDDDMVFKSDKVNIDFLSYYLNLNIHLFKKGGNIGRNASGYELNHLTPEYIGNIEIPDFLSSPGRDIQDRLAKPIGKLYYNLIELVHYKIRDLFCKNNNLVLNHSYNIIKYSGLLDLCEITNTTLFFRNMLKGNINPNNNYLVNIEPRFVTTEYLLYYLYYSNELFCEDNYNNGEFDINEFNGSCLELELPILDDQIKIVQSIYNNHTKLLKLKKKLKESKAMLRELINNLCC